MNLFEQLDRSRAEFAWRLGKVVSGDWSRPTPCTEWNVRDLVNHVIGGCRRYTLLLRGASADEVNATRSLDHIGADHERSFDQASEEMLAGFHESGVLDRTVHHPAGDRTGTELLHMRITDFAVHAWDLAHAIGADDRLDGDLVRAIWERMSIQGTGLTDGSYFAEPPESLDPAADLQAQLLNLTGRKR